MKFSIWLIRPYAGVSGRVFIAGCSHPYIQIVVLPVEIFSAQGAYVYPCAVSSQHVTIRVFTFEEIKSCEKMIVCIAAYIEAGNQAV